MIGKREVVQAGNAIRDLAGTARADEHGRDGAETQTPGERHLRESLVAFGGDLGKGANHGDFFCGDAAFSKETVWIRGA